jgi:hypothetical protein
VPITIPKSILLTPKVPSIAVVGLLLAELLISQSFHNPEPYCTLNVERPHYSTSLKETKGIDAIKLNLTTTCNVPQKYTELTSSIQKIDSNRQVAAYAFVVARRKPSGKSPKIAEFKDLFALCRLSKSVLYSGLATGFVYLENGDKYPVNGNSGKFVAVDCSIGAQ